MCVRVRVAPYSHGARRVRSSLCPNSRSATREPRRESSRSRGIKFGIPESVGNETKILISATFTRSATRGENADRLPPSASNSGVYLQRGGGGAGRRSRGEAVPTCTTGCRRPSRLVHETAGVIDTRGARSDNHSPPRLSRWSPPPKRAAV